MSKKRKAREREETEPTNEAEEETKEEEVLEEVRDQGHNKETEPEAVVIYRITGAELKDPPSEDKERNYEDAQENAPEEAHKEKQTTEEILDVATSIVTVATGKAAAAVE